MLFRSRVGVGRGRGVSWRCCKVESAPDRHLGVAGRALPLRADGWGKAGGEMQATGAVGAGSVLSVRGLCSCQLGSAPRRV
mgnify:CR=1 FL=1